jgi:hypothetical protein
MLVATDYLGPVGLGATLPQLFRANDGKTYVVKLQNNRMGPRILANELLATKFGELLGLCFPSGGIIKLDERLINRQRRLLRAGVTPGRHFGCELLKRSQYVVRHNLYKAVNKAEMAGVMLFDHMFFNFDRTLNRKNLLLRKEIEGWKLYAIDNSHLFGRGRWTSELLEKLTPKIKLNHHRSYGILLKHFLKAENFAGYVEKIKQLTDSCLGEMIDDIPQEWLPHAGERQALKHFVFARRDMVSEIATCLCALIPDKHRGTNAN